MKNYEYIIACLPCPTEDILELLDGRDRAEAELLLRAFDSERLTPTFYCEVLGTLSRGERTENRQVSRFTREFVAFDLNVRNAKVRYLNGKLGRPLEQDTVTGLFPEEDDFEELPAVEEALHGTDILKRERDLDDIAWGKIEKLTELHILDFEIILAAIAKTQIAERWSRLDPDRGRELFRRLVDEIRKTTDNSNTINI